MRKYNQNSRFSLKARVKSVGYAMNGLRSFFCSEPNAWIHLLATIIVILLLVFLQVKTAQSVLIIIVTGMVWIAELFNTAVEKLADQITTEKNEGIKFIKDISAAAVLLAAIIACVTGLIILLPLIFASWT